MDYWIIIESLIRLLSALLIAIAKRKMFKKAWEAWWGAIIPIYNDYLLFKIACHEKWIWWIFCPPVYVFLRIFVLFNISKKFWKSNWFALWLNYIPEIFYPILARWDAKYDKHRKMRLTTMFWRIVACLMWIITLLCSAFIWTLFHPGKNEHLDEIRLKIQTPLMKTLSKYLLDGRADNYLWLIDENEFHYNDPDMISWEEFQPYVQKLKRWDIVFTEWANYLSSIIIPWTRKHTFIYLWNGELVDATSKWVTTWVLQDIDNLSRGSLLKSIIAFRPVLTDEQKETFTQFAFNQLWKPYDFDYNKEDKDAYYCSELVADWLKEAWIDVTYQSKSIWKMVVSPEDMVNYILNEWLNNWEFEELFYLTKLDNWDGTYSLIDSIYSVVD